MTAPDVAALSELLPTAPVRRRVRLVRLRRRQVGLSGIPERYRLQILLLAAERLPGASPAEVQSLADRVANQVRPPRGLLDKAPEKGLDAWFKDHAAVIAAMADGLVP